MNIKQEVLDDVTFGERVAEDELRILRHYFVETEQYRKLISGDIDIVYGPKGSGKSALYALLFSGETFGKSEINEQIRRIGVVNPTESPIFDEIRLEPNATERDFRHLWKLYFLILLATYSREIAFADQRFAAETSQIMDILDGAKLLPDKNEKGLKGHWAAAVRYIRDIGLRNFEVVMRPDATTGHASIAGKLSFGEPSEEQKSLGYISVESALKVFTEAMKRFGLKAWIGIDRLDAAFSDDRQMETKALRALFRVYLDLKGYDNLKLKIFLRDDIWDQLAAKDDGFREASNITKYSVITWDKRSLLDLVIKRALQSSSVREYYGLGQGPVKDIDSKELLFKKIFPSTMREGNVQIDTLDWMLEKVQDASARPCPRELLHLIHAARERQIRSYEQGVPVSEGLELISAQSLWDAVPEVSEFRFTNTFCAEHPRLAVHVRKLKGRRATQSLEALASAFEKSHDEAKEIAEKLVEVGFFSKRVAKARTHYKVPFLYRYALQLR